VTTTLTSPEAPPNGDNSAVLQGSASRSLRGWSGQVAAIAGLAAVYAVAARLGLTLDAVAGFATLVWPPSGIALAALLILGYRVWPGVFVGALVANMLAGASPLVALAIGVGNTLEAVVGVYALRRIPGFRPSLDRVRDVIGLIVLAATLSTMVSATIGVSSLYLSGLVTVQQAGAAWRAWWLGDLIGDLVVAPVILVLATTKVSRARSRRVLEAAALTATVIAVNLVMFRVMSPSRTAIRWPYVAFPILIWAAVRFGQHGAVAMTFLTSVIAVWGTASGLGPFAQSVLHDSLLALQAFMGVLAATFLVLGASITERRQAEVRLRRAHETAAEANRAKSDFLAVMSHELRTPLNAISGYVELMSLETVDPITATQREFLSRIRANQRQLLSMIEDVLSFTKIETGRMTVSVEPVLVRGMLDGLETLVAPELQRKQLTLRCEPCDPSLTVRADPDRLRQILVNVIGNAVKFTATGGRIQVSASRWEDRVQIRVSDTGIGIPAEQLERVFEPFFQVDHGTTRRYPGTGLGLAIARDFARTMGGELRLESQPGRGTTASLELPAA
jgi:signal transduction histidine kinase